MVRALARGRGGFSAVAANRVTLPANGVAMAVVLELVNSGSVLGCTNRGLELQFCVYRVAAWTWVW